LLAEEIEGPSKYCWRIKSISDKEIRTTEGTKLRAAWSEGLELSTTSLPTGDLSSTARDAWLMKLTQFREDSCFEARTMIYIYLFVRYS
jgi:hypothetical protein